MTAWWRTDVCWRCLNPDRMNRHDRWRHWWHDNGEPLIEPCRHPNWIGDYWNGECPDCGYAKATHQYEEWR